MWTGENRKTKFTGKHRMYAHAKISDSTSIFHTQLAYESGSIRVDVTAVFSWSEWAVSTIRSSKSSGQITANITRSNINIVKCFSAVSFRRSLCEYLSYYLLLTPWPLTHTQTLHEQVQRQRAQTEPRTPNCLKLQSQVKVHGVLTAGAY